MQHSQFKYNIGDGLKPMEWLNLNNNTFFYLDTQRILYFYTSRYRFEAINILLWGCKYTIWYKKLNCIL